MRLPDYWAMALISLAIIAAILFRIGIYLYARKVFQLIRARHPEIYRGMGYKELKFGQDFFFGKSVAAVLVKLAHSERKDAEFKAMANRYFRARKRFRVLILPICLTAVAGTVLWALLG